MEDIDSMMIDRSKFMADGAKYFELFEKHVPTGLTGNILLMSIGNIDCLAKLMNLNKDAKYTIVENNRIIEKPSYKERIDMLVKHYELIKKNEGDKKAILDIKTHALAYLKYIPGTKELKVKISSCKTNEEFYKCINELYNFIK